jgi:SAM-dependent methyltransferase
MKNNSKIFGKRYFSSGFYFNYLKEYKRVGKIYAKRLVKILTPKKTWRFLDVGCGMGGIVLALRRMGFEAFGTEVSEFCLKNSPAKKWMVKASCLNLPFKKESFEVVISIDVLEYLKPKECQKAIKELSRISKIFLYLESISKFSPNASQRLNPDSKREKNLLTTGEVIRLVEKEGFFTLGRIFEIEKNFEFNCLFLKNKRKNRRFLISLWKKSNLI